MQNQESLEHLTYTLGCATEILALLLASAPMELAKISVTEGRLVSNLPESGLMGWLNAGEVVSKVLGHLATLEELVDGLSPGAAE